MVDKIKNISFAVLIFIGKCALSLTPVLLMAFGAYCISLGIDSLIVSVLGIKPILYTPPPGYFVLIGLVLMLCGLALTYVLIKKGISSYGWYFSLILNFILMSIIFCTIFSTIVQIPLTIGIFRKGLCYQLNQVINQQSSQRKPSVQKEIETNANLFCESGSKLFNFKYP